MAPDTTAGTRLYRKPPLSAWAALEEYRARFREWLKKPYRTGGDSGALDPEPMTLDPEAESLWVKFHDVVEKDLGPNGELAVMRGWGSKMPEHALRLAALVAAADNPEVLTIDKLAMAHGITLAQHYAFEMRRLAGDAGTSPDLQKAHRLLEWWQGREEKKCHLTTIYQCGPAALRDAATARRIVAILVDHEWLKPLPPGTEIEGVARREAWEIIR